jgi:peptidyl-prolyl cis-trans isomerase B (cyclophilin B)
MPNSAGSQFFLMVADSPHLDGQYASFGQVISGMEEADRIVQVKGFRDRPAEDQRIQKATVETFDIKYPEVVKV